MTTIDTVVVGAGHAGLAVSRLLTRAGREHVVLDRGRVGERWRSERWDSLHLLTPNWMSRLPGWYYTGPDPQGFMSADRFVRHLEGYASSFEAPVVEATGVERLGQGREGYQLSTDQGPWHARHVVIATGPHGAPRIPAGLDRTEVVTSNAYRNPEQLAPGGVLVVGASASGLQIADELNRAGRKVVLSVGSHTRVPRRYRGMDIFWWLASTGRLARTIDQMPDPIAARREPSLQLVGRAAGDLDLGVLAERGVRLAGRLAARDRQRVHFQPDLGDHLALADERLHRLLAGLDEYAERVGLAPELLPAARPVPIRIPEPVRSLDLRAEGIGSVVVAAGFRPDHDWVRLPVLDASGAIRQRRGVTPAPGLYVVGQRFQHRRDSGFIDGARHDAHAVVHHLLTGDHLAEEPTSEESAA